MAVTGPSPYPPRMTSDEAIAVLLLGTDHLIDWAGEGRDDILSPERQAELAAVIECLRAFAPTKVAVEQLASRQAGLDDHYARYLAGSGVEDRNELVQIGFRLARESQASVHAVDADWALQHAPVEEFFAEHPNERFTEDLSGPARDALTDLEQARSALPLRQYLRRLNAAPAVLVNDREYLDRWLPIGAGETWAGVDLVASWYRRNLRIIANLQQVSQSGDRIVVVFGSGHVPSLRHFLEVSGRFAYVSPTDFL